MGKAEIFPKAACRPYYHGAAGRILLLWALFFPLHMHRIKIPGICRWFL